MLTMLLPSSSGPTTLLLGLADFSFRAGIEADVLGVETDRRLEVWFGFWPVLGIAYPN